ncbi:MAG: 30S ribosomal protein S6 [Nitrospiraceae bacterium]
MELYESLFIIRPTLTDEETATLIEKMKGVAEKAGANFMKAENWGRRKLAYEVKRERKGTYAYFYFKGPGPVVAELERAYRLEDSIIKFLSVHLEKEPAAAPAPAHNPEHAGDRY